MRIEWRAQSIEEVDRLSPSVAVEAFPRHAAVVFDTWDDLEVLRFGELWVVVLAQSVTTLFIVIVTRDDPQIDSLNSLAQVEVKLAELAQSCWAREGESVLRPGWDD